MQTRPFATPTKRHVSRAVLVLIVVLGSVAASAQQSRTQVLEQTAEAQIAQGRTDLGIRTLRKALRVAPLDLRLAARMLELLVPTKAHDISFPLSKRVATSCRDAMRLTSSVTAHAVNAPMEREARDPDAHLFVLRSSWVSAVCVSPRVAIEDLSRVAIHLEPTLADMLQELAVLAAKQDDLETVEGALLAARRVSLDTVGITTQLAALRMAQGRASDAAALYREALQRVPRDITLRADLAGALLAAGRTDQALALYRDLASQAPNEVGAQLLLTRALLQTGDARSAVDTATRASAFAQPTDAEPFLLLGSAWSVLHDDAQSRAAYEEALRRDPGNALARSALDRSP